MTQSVSDIIEKQVAASYRYRSAVEEPWTYPSEEFEKLAGISGISRDYAMPQGKDPKELYVAFATTEARHEILAGYQDVAAEMGGLSADRWREFAASLQEQKAQFQKEFKELQANGSLDAVEQKAAQGYSLQSKLRAMAGLRDLVQAGCSGEMLQHLYTQARDDTKQALDGLYDELEALNPELSVLTSQIENPVQKRFVVLGALSKYNVADIKAFSIDGITWQEAQKDPKWARQWEQIQQKTGGELNGWIPSKSTQMRILDQLRQREPQQMGVA